MSIVGREIENSQNRKRKGRATEDGRKVDDGPMGLEIMVFRNVITNGISSSCSVPQKRPKGLPTFISTNFIFIGHGLVVIVLAF